MSVAAPAAPARAPGIFSMKVVIALVLVGVFTFSAFFTLTAFAPELTSGDDGRAHALSRSAVGFAAAARLAQSTGAPVTVSRAPPAERDESALVILAPDAPLDAEALQGLSHQRVLIILPKWGVGPLSSRPGWVQRYDALTPTMVAMYLQGIAPEATAAQAEGEARPTLAFAANSVIGKPGETLKPGAIDRLQTIAGAGLDPALTTSSGGIVLAQLHDRPVYILADPDLLNTQGLANLDTARAGMALLNALRDEGDAIVFDVTMNGFTRSRSLLRTAFQPPFLGATLSLLAVALLLGWRSITRSAPAQHVRRVIALGKRALAENSAALIRLTKREHRMGWGYVQMTSAGVIELLGLGRSEEAQTIALLDRVGAAQGVREKFSDLAAEASAAENGAQVLTAARKLHLWKEEIVRATR